MNRKPSKYKRTDKGLSDKSAISDAEHRILIEMNNKRKSAN